MSISNLFKDPGFIITSILAIISIVIAIRYAIQARLSEISFYPSQFIFLVDNLLSEYKDIKISYKRKPIDKNISLFKGVFINTGKDDIDFNDAEKNLKIILPDECKIVKTEITSKSENFKIDIIESPNNEIEFKAGIFALGEFFHIETIISFTDEIELKSNDSKNLYAIIDFDHRVKNLKKKVKKFDLNNEAINGVPENKTLMSIQVILALTFTIFVTFLNPRHHGPMTTFSYEFTYVLIDSLSNDSIPIRVIPNGKDSVEISSLNDDYKKVVSLDDFYTKEVWIPRITKVTEDKSLEFRITTTMGAFFIVSLFLVFNFIQMGIVSRRRKKIMSLVKAGRVSKL